MNHFIKKTYPILFLSILLNCNTTNKNVYYIKHNSNKPIFSDNSNQLDEKYRYLENNNFILNMKNKQTDFKFFNETVDYVTNKDILDKNFIIKNYNKIYTLNHNTVNYLFLHGLNRCDQDLEPIIYEVKDRTNVNPLNLCNYRGYGVSSKIKMEDQLKILYDGLISYYGSTDYMINKKIIISGHSQGSSIAILLGQLLNYLYNMEVLCPIYSGILNGTSAAKLYTILGCIGAEGLLPNSNFMKSIHEGFKVLEIKKVNKFKILPFAAKVPHSCKKYLYPISFIKNLSYLREDNDTMLSLNSQLCKSLNSNFIYKDPIIVEACHENPNNLIFGAKHIASFIFKDVKPILEHKDIINQTVKNINEWSTVE